jgi:hypothetical protein
VKNAVEPLGLMKDLVIGIADRSISEGKMGECPI